MERRVGTGDILNTLAGLVSDARIAVAMYVLVLGILSAVGVAINGPAPDYTGLEWGFTVEPEESFSQNLIELASFLASLVGGFLLLRAYLRTRDGDHGEGKFWSYLGMAILSGFGILIGSLLFIVPGIFLLVRWSAASGFVLGGRAHATDGLSASWQATKGHGWAIFFAGLAMIVIVIFAAGVLGADVALLSPMAGAIVSAFLDPLLVAVMMGFGIAVYLQVSDATEELGDVFA